MKTCLRCEEAKPLDEFSKDKVRKDGMKVYCRPCDRAMQAQWYEKRYGIKHPLKQLRNESAQERFALSYQEDESGCWIWQGRPRGSNGYGCLKVDGLWVGAHRFSYQTHVGPIPDGLLVLHRCDVPMCVNPAHLFIGTNQDNSDDKVSKGRQARGPELAAALRKGRNKNGATV
jgi:hypothetical protein